MTIAQFIVAYAVCWWLVLFMVLPHRADPSPSPMAGHAPSAPQNPRLKRKFLLTTLLAFLPTLLIYLVSNSARAEEGIYHVGGGCEPLALHRADDTVSTRDGYGTGDKKVAPANLDGGSAFDAIDHVDIPLDIPTKNYINTDKFNVDLSESNASIGKLRVGMDGSTSLNGWPIKNQATYGADCAPKTEAK
jgi:predicted secreted protein